MKKATKVFGRKKISVYDLPQRRTQKEPKPSKKIILNFRQRVPMTHPKDPKSSKNNYVKFRQRVPMTHRKRPLGRASKLPCCRLLRNEGKRLHPRLFYVVALAA